MISSSVKDRGSQVFSKNSEGDYSWQVYCMSHTAAGVVLAESEVKDSPVLVFFAVRSCSGVLWTKLLGKPID